MNLTPVTLQGRWISLEAIDERHAPGIFEAMRDDEVCRYLAWEPPKSLDETLALVREANDAMARGQAGVYAQVWNATGRAIGSTFLGRDYWRTPANTESKYLFLRHCFESLGCVRVALKTDGRNLRSQEAIERLGAVREGVLRRHMRIKGYQRDTVYFSIIDDEWPAVKARLEARLARN